MSPTDDTLDSMGYSPFILWDAPAPPRWFRPEFATRLGPVLLGGSTSVLSIVIIIATVVTVRGRLYMWCMLCILGIAVIYWTILRWRTNKDRFFSVSARTHGIDDLDDTKRQCCLCAGESRGRRHRHHPDGYLAYNEVSISWSSRLFGDVQEDIGL